MQALVVPYRSRWLPKKSRSDRMAQAETAASGSRENSFPWDEKQGGELRGGERAPPFRPRASRGPLRPRARSLVPPAPRRHLPSRPRPSCACRDRGDRRKSPCGPRAGQQSASAFGPPPGQVRLQFPGRRLPAACWRHSPRARGGGARGGASRSRGHVGGRRRRRGSPPLHRPRL